MYPSLTPRLQAVANLVPQGARLADVGTDHAYLPAYLLEKKQISSAIATDICPGPLGRATETVKRCCLQKRLELRLCNGLDGINAGEVDAIVVAGMGGETILSILEKSRWSLEKRCILQPMSAVEELRKGLEALGIGAWREVLARERDTLYVVLSLDGTMDVKEEPLTPAEEYVGRAKWHENDPLWEEYLAFSKKRVEKVLKGLSKSDKPGNAKRQGYFEEILSGLEEMSAKTEEISGRF